MAMRYFEALSRPKAVKDAQGKIKAALAAVAAWEKSKPWVRAWRRVAQSTTESIYLYRVHRALRLTRGGVTDHRARAERNVAAGGAGV
jgi:hypothetical protein